MNFSCWIAERLYISIRNVQGHRNNLLKTGCRNMVGLVLSALRNDIFELSL